MTADLDDIAVGTELPPLELPPISRITLALFGPASGDLNPIHLDLDVARSAGLDDVIAHGMLSMAYLGRLLTGWVDQHRIRSYAVRFAAITPVHARPTCRGRVTAVRTADGTTTLTGVAVVALGSPRNGALMTTPTPGALIGRVALVSGSGRGIGREIALKLAAGGTATTCAGSVTGPDFAQRFVDTAIDTYGGLHVIINNAGHTWTRSCRR